MLTDADRYTPQLATAVEAPPCGPEWIHELAYNGYRMGALVASNRVQLRGRRELDWSSRFPEVAEALRQLVCRSAIIDGEIAIAEHGGSTSLKRLRQMTENGGTREGLTFFMFDLLELDDIDLTLLPLTERKAQLETLVAGQEGILRYARHFEGDGDQALEYACRLGYQGIVSKRRRDRYVGGLTESWVKVKCAR